MTGLFRKSLTILNILALTVLFSTPAGAALYEIDKSHSSIGFTVSHLMVSTVRGEFFDYTGTINWDPNDPTATTAETSIQAASINTNEPDRDKHLIGGEFFDVGNHPNIIFKSKSVRREGSLYLLTGDLTIRGITKEITLPAAINGPVKSPFGKNVIGLTGQTTINRQDFGVSWNKSMDQGGVVVGDEVTLEINLEANKGGDEMPKKEEPKTAP